MAKQPVEFDAKSFVRYLVWVERGEQRFVLAKTLTQVANEARKLLREDSRQKWTVRSQFVLKGYQTNMATKKNLQSEVGHLDWYAEDQLAEGSSDRRPRSSKWRYIPLKGVKKTKRGKIPKRLSPERIVAEANKPNSKTFFMRSKKKKDLLIASRKGKKRLPITVLYRLVPEQRIMPTVSMTENSADAAKKGQEFFNKNMDSSLKRFAR